jgi:general secretion pathway protein H
MTPQPGTMTATHARRSLSGSAAPRAANVVARGVTLLELLIVLSIMAIVAAMVVPMFGGGVSSSEMKSAARQIAAALRVARSDAVASRHETRLILNLEQRTFQVDSDPRQHALPKQLEMKLFTAQRDIVDEKVGAIRFYPDGGSNGGRVTIAAGERKYDIDIDWLTGRVAIAD